MRVWQINTGGFPLYDIMSDQATKGTNPGDGLTTAVFEDFTYDSNDPAMDRYWKTLYLAIRRANLVINRVPNIDMDEGLRNRLVGEARFLRGYFYSLLTRGFGDAVLTTDENPPLDLVKSEELTILNELIIPDLEFAAEALPFKGEYDPEDYGRATKGAANALLARIHLFYGDFSSAEEHALAVINSNQYQLETDYADIWLPSTEHGVESIFEVGALPLPTSDGGNQFGNTQGIRGTPNRGWGFGRPAYPWIVQMVNEDDPRMDPTVIFLGEVLDGVVTGGDANTPDTTYDDNNNIIEIEVYNQKAWHPGTQAVESFGHNRRIIRYSDVLLMAAEALNENGNPTQALTYLNEVRARARGNNPAILPDITTTDQAQLRDLIAEERNDELAMEGLRFWDLLRTGKAVEVLGPLGFTPNKNERFPVPQSEIDISEGRITQNEGY